MENMRNAYKILAVKH